MANILVSSAMTTFSQAIGNLQQEVIDLSNRKMGSGDSGGSGASGDSELVQSVVRNTSSIARLDVEVGGLANVVASSNTTITEAINNLQSQIDGEHVELTQAEYDALSTEEKMSGKVYFITDGEAATAVDQTYNATSAKAQSGKAVAEALNGIAIKLWQASYQLSGQETRQIDLPSNVFAYNLVFSNNSGLCDNYTHFGPGFGARHIILRNSASDVNTYIYMGVDGQLITNTSATGIQLQLQVLYLEK